MAFQLTLPTLIGVIVGGVTFIFCVAVAIVVVSLRIKHRRQLTRTNAAGERRLSGYPGGHLSITDSDVAQMPGTGAAMRDALYNRYTRTSAYAPMASRESVEKQPNKAVMPRMSGSEPATIQNNRISSIKLSPVSAYRASPWPMPRRLTRSNRPPAIELRLSAQSLTIDATKKPERLLVTPERAEISKLMPRDERSRGQSPQLYHDIQKSREATPEILTSQSPILRPKPLFHEKQRSMSHGMISAMNRQTRSRSINHAQDSHRPPTYSHGLGMPRSISLTTQGPGAIPASAIPPLPAEALLLRRQRSRKASDLRQSLVAANSRPILHGVEGNGRDSLTTTPRSGIKISESPGNQLKKEHAIDDRKKLRPPVSPTVARIGALKGPLEPRKSFQADIQDTIPRSNSSGLSESLLNHGWSRSVSNASMVKEATHARSKAPIGAFNVGAHISVFDFGLPLRSDTDIATLSQLESDDSQAKRRSASILKMISGNEQSPALASNAERPVSIATENPLRWSMDILATQITEHGLSEKGVVKARQRPTRSSIKQPYTPTSRSSRTPSNVQTSKFSWTPPQSQAQSLRRPRIDPPAFRPPSKLTFDPQLTQPLQSKAPSIDQSPTPNLHLNNTLAILTGQEDSDSSTSSPPSTPTRKPSQKRQPSGTHPNRQRAIFDGSSKITQWPLAGQHPALSLGLRGTTNGESPEKANNIFRLDAQLNSSKQTGGRAPSAEIQESITEVPLRPPSLLYRFPSPPSPPLRRPNGSSGGDGMPSISNKLQSQSQPNINKMRLGGSISSLHQDTRFKTTSDLSGDNHRDDEEITNSPGVRESVLTLRRMNSEISEPSKAGKEHRRYLSLGGRQDAIFEDGDGDDGGSVAGSGITGVSSASTVTKVLDGPATMLLSSKRRGDEGGKENARGERGVVKGPRAMPGWLDESMMLSSPSSYAPNV